MWNKLDMSFRSAGSAQQFKDFLNGMEDEVCECTCNTFNCICVCCNPSIPCALIASFHFLFIVSLYIIIHSADSSS